MPADRCACELDAPEKEKVPENGKISRFPKKQERKSKN
jgi:hypothetical protein